MKSVTVLNLKIATGGEETLQHVADLCRRAWNAAVDDWLLRHRAGKDESARQAQPSTRRTKRYPNGEPRPMSESNKIYHAVREAVPELGTTQASMVAQSVHSHLSAKVDWRRSNGSGKKLRRRDLILSYEERPPFTTRQEIPLHNKQVRILFGERIGLSIARPVDSLGALEVELSQRGLPPGKQRMVAELADGRRKLSDSRVVYKPEKGEWYWHVPVTFEIDGGGDDEATLYPVLPDDNGTAKTDRPFRLELPGRAWYVGDGRYLLAQVRRLTGLRKEIGWRYRQRMGAGHGRKKVDAAVRKRRRQERNVRAEFRRRAIADIVKQCVRAGVGVLHYREPTGPLRKRCWFRQRGLDFDWTRFASDLKNSAARKGIEVKVKRWKWKEAIGDGEKAAS